MQIKHELDEKSLTRSYGEGHLGLIWLRIDWKGMKRNMFALCIVLYQKFKKKKEILALSNKF